MKRKWIALLLSALVMPGLGQLYLGRRLVGGVVIAIVNLILLLALFVVLKGLSPLIASRIAAGSVSVAPSEVLQAIEGVSGFGKAVLGAFFLVWAFSVTDIIRYRGEN